MAVVVKLLPETDISYRQLADLLHAAFEERLEQGLRFTCSTMTVEQFESKMKDGLVFVAVDEENDNLLGTVTIHLRREKRGRLYGYQEYLAVHPGAKHTGVATKLCEAWDANLRARGATYVMSDTACEAASSVKWHLKNGFKIYELESYRSTDYWSYVFIKYLDDSTRKSSLRIIRHYWLSWIFIKLTRNKNGSDTKLGVLFKKFRAGCKN